MDIEKFLNLIFFVNGTSEIHAAYLMVTDRFQKSESRQGEDTPTTPIQLEVLASPIHQGKKKNHTHFGKGRNKTVSVEDMIVYI